MTELERHALLGDKQAQDECTEKGILLPCPFCGGKAMIEYDDIMPFEYSVFCEDCGVVPSVSEDKQVAISVWNTRPAPPIGRCGECKHFKNMECTNEELSTDHEGGASYSLNFDEYDFCSYFEPKEREENVQNV